MAGAVHFLVIRAAFVLEPIAPCCFGFLCDHFFLNFVNCVLFLLFGVCFCFLWVCFIRFVLLVETFLDWWSESLAIPRHGCSPCVRGIIVVFHPVLSTVHNGPASGRFCLVHGRCSRPDSLQGQPQHTCIHCSPCFVRPQRDTSVPTGKLNSPSCRAVPVASSQPPDFSRRPLSFMAVFPFFLSLHSNSQAKTDRLMLGAHNPKVSRRFPVSSSCCALLPCR